jgi:hypothetical protein
MERQTVVNLSGVFVLWLLLVLGCGGSNTTGGSSDTGGGTTATGAASSGGTLTKEIVAREVKKLFEVPAQPGYDGATTADIHSIQIGSPHQSLLYDIGKGKEGRMVYPARVSWTWRHHYNSRTTVDENVTVFDCIINDFDEWECGQSSEVESNKKMPDEPPTVER